MPEVVISGGIFSFLMAHTAHALVGSFALSSATAERQMIEGKISNNMQLIHQANIKLSTELKTNQAELTNACSSPTSYLATELFNPASVAFVPAPLTNHESKTSKIKRTIIPDNKLGLTRVIYSFEAPEQNVKSEQRVVELHPHFQSQCPLIRQSNASEPPTSKPKQHNTTSQQKRSTPATKKTNRKRKQATKDSPPPATRTASPSKASRSRTAKPNGTAHRTTTKMPTRPRNQSVYGKKASRGSNGKRRCSQALRLKQKC